MTEGDWTDIEAAWAGSILSGLPTATRERLITGARHHSVGPGASLYVPRDPVRVMLVGNGLARVMAVSPDGRAAAIRMAGPGQFLGLTALLSGRSSAAADAVTRLEFWDLDVRTFDNAARTDVQVAYRIAQSLAGVTEETIDLISVNIFGSVRQRVSRQLLDFAEDVDGRFVVRASQQEIASGIGSVREVVARAIRGLKDDGLIDRSPEGLRILDPAALHQVAAGEG